MWNATELAGDLNQTGNVTKDSNSSSGMKFQYVGFVMNYKLLCFCLVIFVGLVGSCANGVVLGAFVFKKQKNKAINKLIVNQIALDLFASVALVLSYSAKVNENFYIYQNKHLERHLVSILREWNLTIWWLDRIDSRPGCTHAGKILQNRPPVRIQRTLLQLDDLCRDILFMGERIPAGNRWLLDEWSREWEMS